MSKIPEARWRLSGFGDEIDKDPSIQVAVLQALGANHIEVRSAWGTNILELTAAQLSELADYFAEREVSVSAIASPIGKVDVALPIDHEVTRLSLAIAAARRLQTKYIRIFSFYYEGREVESVRDEVVERMRALTRAAEDAGVVLLHENEKNIYGDVPSRVSDLIETIDSPALKVAWDPANFVQVGVKPFDVAYPKLREHIAYVQIKDARMKDGVVTPAGSGDGQISETIVALRDSGYDGFVSLEPHLTGAFGLGGFSGPSAFGLAARSLRNIVESAGVELV